MTAKILTDIIYGIALFINAALFIPQALKIYAKKNADEVSLLTFGGFNCIQLCGFINGIYHDDYALIFGQAFSLITCGLVTLQIIYFKLKCRSSIKAKVS